MNKARKEFTFDLDTNSLKDIFGEKSYAKAYNELFDFFCKFKGFEHRQGSVYCTNILMDDYDVWKVSCELQEKCPWIVKSLTRMDVTDIGKTHEITHWIMNNAEYKIKAENISEVFIEDLKANGYMPSDNIIENYQKLTKTRDEIISLQDISNS